MTAGERRRAVAIINLMIGVVIGVVLVVTVQAGREGFIFSALGVFSVCLLVVGYRIYRVFQVID